MFYRCQIRLTHCGLATPYAIWWHRSGSTMAQVILTAPSHHLNQCWLVAGDIRWHPPESNFTKSAQAAFLYDKSENGVNSLAPGKFEWNSKHEIFKQIDGLLWYCPNMKVTRLHRWSVNIGSGNGLVPSGNKPLPEPMVTQICVAIWRHWATMS